MDPEVTGNTEQQTPDKSGREDILSQEGAKLPPTDSLLQRTVRFLNSLNPFAEPSYHPGGPYYYKGFASYHFPPRPTDEITAEQAVELGKHYAYYVAHFNDDGKIALWEKHYPDGSQDSQTFMYEGGVIRRSELLWLDGTRTVRNYDQKGRRIDDA